MPNSGKLLKIVIDTYAWVEYFRGSSEGKKAKKFIDGQFELFTPSIVIAELSDKYHREGIGKWETRKRFIKLKTKILSLDDRIANSAGKLKQDLKKKYRDAGLADSIILSHALDIGAKILTGDKHLKHLKNSIDISH